MQSGQPSTIIGRIISVIYLAERRRALNIHAREFCGIGEYRGALFFMGFLSAGDFRGKSFDGVIPIHFGGPNELISVITAAPAAARLHAFRSFRFNDWQFPCHGIFTRV